MGNGRFKLISCEVFYREMCAAISRSPHVVDVEFLPKGLHDIGARKMHARVQEALDRVEETRYDAVLFGYGLCNNGLAGLTARGLPLVVPRAHDCITIFLGSRQRYLDYFNAHPGVYFKTTGWVERGENPEELSQISLRSKAGLNASLETMIARYGEDNGRYLYETLGDDKRNYSQFTFIRMGVEPNDSYERHVREEAAQREWGFEQIDGDLRLVQRLVNGEWSDDEFLFVPPGHKIVAHYTDGILAAERSP